MDKKAKIILGIVAGLVATISTIAIVKKVKSKNKNDDADNSNYDDGSNQNQGNSNNNNTADNNSNILNGLGGLLGLNNSNISLDDLKNKVNELLDSGKAKKVSYVSFRKGQDVNFVPHLASPRPDYSWIKGVKRVAILNMGKYNGIYKVKGAWKSSGEKLGAIYLNSKHIEVSNEADRTWQDKGIIIKL